MLISAQIDHFSTFGFVTLPGLLGATRVEELRAEVDTAIRDAYAATYDQRVIDGISGHYLPMASRLTPLSAALVCDDPVLINAAEQIVGQAVLPSVPEGILYFGEAGWHNDDGIGVQDVKFATYFDALDATNGALCFVPCSHHADATASLRAYQHAHYQDFLTRKVLQRGEFESREDLVTKMLRFIEHHSETAKPFKWVYDAKVAA
ncbi:MAG: phytanoyl-CoA dioxygenase family protein [Acidimicrobiales bacterium]